MSAGLQVLSATIVVYTQGAGPESPEEFLAPSGQVAAYEVPLVAPGNAAGRVVGAWHTPIDNLPSLGAFVRLDVVPSEQHPGAVRLTASGQPGQQGRIRLRITALCEPVATRGGY